MRHIDVKQKFVKDAVLENNMYIVHIGTEEQHADTLIKPLNDKLRGKHASALLEIAGLFDWIFIAGTLENVVALFAGMGVKFTPLLDRKVVTGIKGT